jgi:hypothetical protein
MRQYGRLHHTIRADRRPDHQVEHNNRPTRQWSASDFAIENLVWIRQHPLGLLTRGGGSDHDRARAWQRPARPTAKRFLTPLQKYEIRKVVYFGGCI